MNIIIKNSFNYVFQKYIEYIKNDVSMEKEFSNTTINKIYSKVSEMNSTLSKYYADLLNIECKKKFIDSYTKVMNEQTNNMIQTIEDLKLDLRSKIDDIFTIDIENDLSETNKKQNMTLESIKEYEIYINTFKLPDNLIAFLDSYGDTIIQSSYDGLETLINKITRNETLSYLEKNIEVFLEKLDIKKFLEHKDNIYTAIGKNIIDKIKANINSYVKEDYPNKLNDEIDRLEGRRLRRLSGEETEKDIYEEIKEASNENTISQNLNKLLLKSENTINYIKTFESFDKFNEIINKNIKKLNISYKETKQIIDNAYSEDDIYPTLNDELEALYEYALGNYTKMNESYNSLRKYIDDSLYEIDEQLNLCTNATYQTFINKYENISKKSIPFDIEQNNGLQKDKKVVYTKNASNFEFEIKADISSIDEKARFKYNLILEGEGRMKEAKGVASVINEIKAQKASIEIIKNLPNSCGQSSQKIDIDFNTVNFTANLFFDSKYNILNVSIDKDFIYKYNIQKYEVEENEEDIENCYSILGTQFCQKTINCKEPIKIDEPELKTVIIKEKGETFPINN